MYRILLALLLLISPVRADSLNVPSPIQPYTVAGSWTPADASGAGLAFTGVSVSYTRIGNLVWAYGRLSYPVTVNGTLAIISGLPFTITASTYGYMPCLVLIQGNFLGMTTNAGTTQLVPTTTAGAQATNAQLSGTLLEFQCTYTVI